MQVQIENVLRRQVTVETVVPLSLRDGSKANVSKHLAKRTEECPNFTPQLRSGAPIREHH